MKKSKYIILIIASLLCASHVAGKEQTALDTENKKLSYTFGHKVGKTFGANKNVDLEVDAFLSGIRDALLKNKTSVTQDEMESVEAKFQKKIMAKMDVTQKKLAEENSIKGKAFLKENKKRAGVITLHEGVQYEILKEGKGKRPELRDQIVANYTGKLLSGKEFANTYRNIESATFYLNRVFEGWKKVLPKMRTGAKWKLFLAPEYAYGEKGVPPTIGPEETLIFEVELLEIKED